MKAPLFFLTTISLGAMAGISGNHYFQVKEIVRQHEQGIISREYSFVQQKGVQVPKNQVTEQIISSRSEKELQGVIDEPVEVTTSDSLQMESKPETLDKDVVMEILAAMKADRDAFRQQLAETNRDLAEANFRLDTHSDSFKPLRTESERSKTLDASDEIDGFQLLPPK